VCAERLEVIQIGEYELRRGADVDRLFEAQWHVRTLFSELFLQNLHANVVESTDTVVSDHGQSDAASSISGCRVCMNRRSAGSASAELETAAIANRIEQIFVMVVRMTATPRHVNVR
jgi:hypothetical protein